MKLATMCALSCPLIKHFDIRVLSASDEGRRGASLALENPGAQFRKYRNSQEN